MMEGAGMVLSPREAVLAGAALFFLTAWLLTVLLNRSARARTARLEAEVALLSAAQKYEYRVERFDLLWFPVVTVVPAKKEVSGVAPGLPHCAKDGSPFAAGEEEWSCPACGDKRPGTIASVEVLDAVTREALALFQARHKEFQAPGR